MGVTPSGQQPYLVPAHPPIGFDIIQFDPEELCFAVTPSGQQPYLVPAHPPIGFLTGFGFGKQFDPLASNLGVLPS